jgi:hypothetical protein
MNQTKPPAWAGAGALHSEKNTKHTQHFSTTVNNKNNTRQQQQLAAYLINMQQTRK